MERKNYSGRFALGTALLSSTIAAFGGYFIGRQSPTVDTQSFSFRQKYVDKDELFEKRLFSDVVGQFYDPKNNDLLQLSDIDKDGKIDHLEIRHRSEHYPRGLSHIYISRELAPTARENEHFKVVEPSAFELFDIAIEQ